MNNTAKVTTKTTYGELQNGDVVYIQGIPMTVHNLRISETNLVRFTGIFNESEHEWARGYSGGTYGAYAWIECVIEARV